MTNKNKWFDQIQDSHLTCRTFQIRVFTHSFSFTQKHQGAHIRWNSILAGALMWVGSLDETTTLMVFFSFCVVCALNHNITRVIRIILVSYFTDYAQIKMFDFLIFDYMHFLTTCGVVFEILRVIFGWFIPGHHTSLHAKI